MIDTNKDWWWLNEDSQTFLSRGYLRDGMDAKERVRNIAERAEELLNLPGYADKFVKYMARGYYSLSSPIWSNFGTNRGLPISCNGVYIEDSIESMLGKISEVGMQTKMGAGTSGYIGAIRPRGSAISTGGTADGPVHYANLFEMAVDIISQGNVRRGSMAVYLDIDSPDIMEFLESREEGSTIQNLSLGVCVSDKFMEEMIAGDPDKRAIWARILRKRKESGYPYIFFSDTVNNNAPEVLKKLNRKIWASNLCLKGDTKIEVLFPFDETSTSITIEEFVKLWEMGAIIDGTKVRGQNGFYNVSAAAMTGKTKEMIRITNEDGSVIECTPEHKIFTKNRGWVEAQYLKEDDELHVE